MMKQEDLISAKIFLDFAEKLIHSFLLHVDVVFTTFNRCVSPWTSPGAFPARLNAS